MDGIKYYKVRYIQSVNRPRDLHYLHDALIRNVSIRGYRSIGTIIVRRQPPRTCFLLQTGKYSTLDSTAKLIRQNFGVWRVAQSVRTWTLSANEDHNAEGL